MDEARDSVKIEILLLSLSNFHGREDSSGSSDSTDRPLLPLGHQKVLTGLFPLQCGIQECQMEGGLLGLVPQSDRSSFSN